MAAIFNQNIRKQNSGRAKLCVVALFTLFLPQVLPQAMARAARLGSDSVPATPLVACDPYFSIWSTGKSLTDVDTTHWTGKSHRLVSLVEIDGKVFRLMGAEPKGVQGLKQTSSSITPTQTNYTFQGSGVKLSLTFTTPLLPDDIDMLSRPITYLTYKASSLDGETHKLRIYFEASAELCVNTPEQAVVGETIQPQGFTAIKLGSQLQPTLETSGDDLRIDWGYFYLAAPQKQSPQFAVAEPDLLRSSFISGQSLPVKQVERKDRADELSAAVVVSCEVDKALTATRWLVVAYDDIQSIEFMGSPLEPYWRRDGLDAEGLLAEAVRDHDTLLARCDEFDRELTADLTAAGGPEYAAIATLSYRQCFAAGKFVADANGQPIQFCKENNSNGCIATSDVFYPMAPQFLLFGPSLAKSFVVPFMEYAVSERWKFPFAPHDLGTYPKANGQVYGGGERSEENQMPVEECGNLLILMGAIAKIDGNADFASRYWPTLEQWAKYLKEEGFDPDNQLCTDDFAGHLAHNVNLSAKAICGLAAFSQLCELRGDEQQAQAYRKTAEDFAARWIEEADDGDHFRLAFDKPGTWSQKYNLVWDSILGLHLFPDEVFQKEMAYYRRIQNTFGLPLDNRKTYSKLDWILWTATLTRDQEDFAAIVQPVYKFLQETPDRVPMTDWYKTDNARKVGFKARPVVGGVFLKMLYDDAVWKKWSAQDRTKSEGFAPMPTAPTFQVVVPAADVKPAEWKYTTEQPEAGWFDHEFDDSTWRVGQSGFGMPGPPDPYVRTTWNTSDIWLRRSFDFPGQADEFVRLHVFHDEEAEIYINGVLARRVHGYTAKYGELKIRQEALQALKPTGNIMAVHCSQSSGGQYIDVGFTRMESETTQKKKQ